ncbi:MAG: nitrous oxide reductase family maturation protein NosD [bacterium]
MNPLHEINSKIQIGRLRTFSLREILVCIICLGMLVYPATSHATSPLKKLVDSTPRGKTLQLKGKTYRGPVTIDKSMTISGTKNTRIVGNDSGSVITVTGTGVKLNNVHVRGDGGKLDRDDAVIFLRESQQSQIKNCTVSANAFGIYVYGGSGHVIRNNRVTGNRSRRVSNRGNGIHLWKTTNNRVINNKVSHARDGIYLSFAHDNLIKANRSRELRYGIHYMYSERNRLLQNRLFNNTGGAALMYSRENTIKANKADHNEKFGILLMQLEHSKLISNRTHHNNRGLFIQNSAGNRLVQNSVQRNHIGVYLSSGSVRNVFTRNIFSLNDSTIVLKGSRQNQWASDGTGNYWEGHYGFDSNGDGISDQPRRIQSATDSLVTKDPRYALFLHSPLAVLVDYLGGWIDFGGNGVKDPYPLQSPPVTTFKNGGILLD